MSGTPSSTTGTSRRRTTTSARRTTSTATRRSPPAEATDDYAILRVGARGNYLKRQSARLVSKKDWTYFLAAAHFTHVPMGCGVWPAWWTHCHTEGVIWPNGGELDILEHAGDLPGKVSFHTGAANDCTLSESVTNACPGVANFIDKNQCPIAGSCDMVSAVWGEEAAP